ncbi:mechanosensitive ion channel, partial [Lichenihabitans sp. Uapishka_5]|uniref:mechanosensitive ion channel family protein n=1 Tax=Lichenihabitans sp. Uapishka_5 TaxID=3037302 RepID=UPI0029E80DAA
ATETAWRDGDEGEATAEAAGEQSLGLLAILSVVRLAILLVGMVVAFAVIDLPVDALLSGESPAARAVLRLGGAVALLLLAQTCWVAIRTGIDRRLLQLGADDPHAGSAEHTRLLTLLPLLRTTLLIAFAVLFGLSALWTLGIEITPLLAGAGIFGLAIGFGAQTLVRDVISGVFFLVEDVFRIGEYIESGSSTKGTVERITLRTVALRHQNGPIHFVPYGALGTVRNTSRDWVIDKFDLPLPVTADSERVRKLVKRIGETLQADPEFGPLFREPLKAKLSRIDPGVKVFRCKFTTLPGRQFDLRAAALRGIEAALAEAGILFAEKP